MNYAQRLVTRLLEEEGAPAGLLSIDLTGLNAAVGKNTTYFAGSIVINGASIDVESTDRDVGQFGDEGTKVLYAFVNTLTPPEDDDKFWVEDVVAELGNMIDPGESKTFQWNGCSFEEVS